MEAEIHNGDQAEVSSFDVFGLPLIVFYPPKKSYPFRTGNVESRRGDFYPILDPHRIPDSILLRRVKLSGPRSV